MHALISMVHHWSQATRGTGTAVKVVLFDNTPIKILGPVFCSYVQDFSLAVNREAACGVTDLLLFFILFATK